MREKRIRPARDATRTVRAKRATINRNRERRMVATLKGKS